MLKYKAMWMRMSKGSKQRPKDIKQEQFDKNWDKIFGKKKKNGKL